MNYLSKPKWQKCHNQNVSFTYFFISLVLSLTGCVFGDPSDEVDNYFLIDDAKYKLSYGVLDDNGTNYDITGRYYGLEFKSSSSSIPENYISFRLLSTSTSRLQEGTYYYNDDDYPVYGLKIGYDLQYDGSNNAVEGIRLNLSYDVKSGTIVISRANGNYEFEFEFEIEKDEKSYAITGYFIDVLNTGYVY